MAAALLGLAGMAALRPETGVRLLRPLLSVSRPAIRDWLRSRGQTWIEDPSNALTKFERVRIRQSLGASEAEQLRERARQAGHERDRSERAAAALLAEAAQVHDSGYVAIGLEPFLATRREVRAAALRQVMLSVSGADYAPDLEDILSAVASGGHGAWTLGGCQLQVLQDRLCVFREAAAIPAPVPVAPGWSGSWDNRFGLRVAGGLSLAAGWAIGPLGEAGLRQAVDRFGIRLKRHAVPLAARLALPGPVARGTLGLSTAFEGGRRACGLAGASPYRDNMRLYSCGRTAAHYLFISAELVWNSCRSVDKSPEQAPKLAGLLSERGSIGEFR